MDYLLHQKNIKVYKFLFLLGLIVFIFFLYFYKLDSIPNVVHGDEAETALQAIEFLKNPVDNLIGIGWADLPLLSFVPRAITMKLFAQNIAGDRIGSAIFGVITLPFFYLFLKSMFEEKVALLATILLATSHLWIALSRLGISYVQATFFLIACFYFLFHGLKTEKKLSFVLSGVFAGFGLYSYYAIRILPLLVAIPLVFYLVNKEGVKKRILNVLLILLMSFLIYLPQILFFINHPNTFLNRTETVYIFSKPAKEWTNYNENDLGLFVEQTRKTFDIFSGDNSAQYGYKGQLIDWVSIFFLIFGLFAVLRLKTKIKVFLFLWFIISLLGQILTSIPSPIFLPRFVIGLPLLYIFISLGIFKFSKLLNLFPFKKYVESILIFSSIAAIILFNLNACFFLSPKNSIADIGSRISTEVSNYIINESKNSIVYFYTIPYLYPDYPTLRFLLPNIDKKNLMFAKDKNHIVISLIDRTKPTMFVIYPEYSFILEKLAEEFPNGKTVSLINVNKQLESYLFKIN